MKLILTGSLGHISQPTARQLIKLGHDVTVISHSAKRATEIEAMGATPAIGSIDDEAFLAKSFQGADAVYLMITAANNADDIFVAGRQQALIYARAIKAAGVKRVVNLSSVGANLGPEVGALHIYNVIERTLTAELPTVNLTFIRPTGMFYNLYGSLATIRQSQAIYTNNSLSKTGSWVAPADIAPVVVQALTAPAAGNTVQYVASDEKTYPEIAELLGRALGLPALKAIQISDDQALQQLLAAGAPQPFAEQFVKMTAYERENDFYADYRAHQPVLGPTKLADFAQQFAQVYQQQA